MRLGLIADTHFGYARFEEDSFSQARRAFLDACDKCDAILFAGDLFDVKIPKLESIERAVKILREVKEKGVPVYAIHGNHERRTKEMVNPMQLLAAGGLLRYLHAESAVIEKDGEKVQVFGIGSVPEEYAATAVKKAMEGFKPEEGAFKVLLIHQSLKELIPNGSDELSLDDLDGLPFDLIVNGHIHARKEEMGGRLVIPGSTVVTQIKPDDITPRGYVLYDTAAKTREFVPVESRKFFYESLEFRDASPEEVRKAVAEKIKELRGDDTSAVIALKIRGDLKEGLSSSDVSFGSYENVFVDNQLNVATLSAKLEKIRGLRAEKLSVRELAIRELSEKTKGKLTMFDAAELFESLVEGADSTMEYLEGKRQKPK